MKKKAILLAMATFLLAACSNKGEVSSSASEGTLEEVVELMTEYSKLGSFRDGIVEDAFDAAGTVTTTRCRRRNGQSLQQSTTKSMLMQKLSQRPVPKRLSNASVSWKKNLQKKQSTQR